MKKLFFAWIMALWCFPAVFAQSGQGIRYQGEVGVEVHPKYWTD